jgi:hypothetical protein
MEADLNVCVDDGRTTRGEAQRTSSFLILHPVVFTLVNPCLDMNDPTSTPRQIVPGRLQTSPTTPTSDSPPKGSQMSPTSPWKKRVSTACLACKKSKRKVGPLRLILVV